MVSPLHEVLDIINSTISYAITSVICQTLLYGIYMCLVPIVVHAMVINGLQSRARKCLLAIITSMFALVTVYWIFAVFLTFLTIDSFNNATAPCYGSNNALLCLLHGLRGTHHPLSTSKWLGMLSNILFINFIIADGVVVWRAWVLCADQSKVVLIIPVVMLVINTVIYLITVVERAMEVFSKGTRIILLLAPIIDITELVHLTLSLLINIYATSIIALKAWKYRKLLMESGIGIRTPRRAIKILTLLVESGVIYILIGVASLVSITTFMHFKLDDIASVITLGSTQLVGIYPIVVVLLVEKNRSLDTTYSSFGTIIEVRGGRPPQVGPGTLAPEPVLASGSKIDPATKLPNHNTDRHVTFDSTR